MTGMTTYFDVYTKKPRSALDVRWFELIYRRRWDLLEGKLFLDIGAGAGYLGRTAPRAVRVVAVDIDEQAVRTVDGSGEGSAGVLGNAVTLPFRAGVFDGVHCSHVIEHTWEPEALVGEIRRVLRVGGTVVILTPDIIRYGFRFYVDHTHRHPFTRESLRGLLTLHGFGNIRFEYGLFHTTRLELMVNRIFGTPPEQLYPIKKWLGQRFSGEMICVARRDR